MPRAYSLNDDIPVSIVLRRDQINRIRNIINSDVSFSEKTKQIEKFTERISEVKRIDSNKVENTISVSTRDTTYTYNLSKQGFVEAPTLS